MSRPGAGDALRHVALLCRGQADYRAGVTGFIRDALARDDPVLAAVPAQRALLLHTALGRDAARVSFADLTEVGRNPALIIPAIRAFTEHQPAGHASIVCEPAWPGRTSPELVETVRHEALVNLALADTPAAILCPYDRSRLPRHVLTDIRCTHPMLSWHGATWPSDGFAVPAVVPARCEQPLPRPPTSAESLSYDVDLRAVREFVARRAVRAGLPDSRVGDLVLAVSEVAANTLRHTSGPGTLSIWRDRSTILCEVRDQGWIADPLVGRQSPLGLPGRQGLWVVNQMCDLVQIRTGPKGSTVRMFMLLGRAAQRPRRGLRRLGAAVGWLRLHTS
ncbi:MAG TPA: sensor histidine kinase [Streptosporangiaceae bacterium]|nr:sensor histidine kinase [Streptosporangiaceae bacterium]